MSAKKQAIEDIKNALQKEGKCFIAFIEELNPIMDILVHNQILKQQSHYVPQKSRGQLMARCFFTNGTTELRNYQKYYKTKEQHGK